MTAYSIPLLPLSYDLETKAILKQLNNANRRLAELKGVAMTIPNREHLGQYSYLAGGQRQF